MGNPNSASVSQNFEANSFGQRRIFLRKGGYSIKFNQRQSRVENPNPSSFSCYVEVCFRPHPLLLSRIIFHDNLLGL